jgi:hypothetical protein
MGHQSCLLESKPCSILPNLWQWCVEISGKRKVYKSWTIQKHGFLEGGNCAKFNIWNEDEAICGVLGRYLVAFVKTITPSKCNSFGGFGFQLIRGSTMLGLHCQPWWTLPMHKN